MTHRAWRALHYVTALGNFVVAAFVSRLQPEVSVSFCELFLICCSLHSLRWVSGLRPPSDGRRHCSVTRNGSRSHLRFSLW